MALRTELEPETPWVAALADLLRDRLGHEIPSDRLIRDIAPFVMAEAKASGLDDPAALVETLGVAADDATWCAVVKVATIGETYFFRHPKQIEALAVHTRQLHAAVDRPLRIWSAGCSTGEEPWSLAMRLDAEDVPYEITGSDANDAAVERAAAGAHFRDRSVGHLPEVYRDRWLEPVDTNRWRIRRPEALRVRCVRHNLITEPPLLAHTGRWDLIVCRNVLIYFTPSAGRELIRRLGSVLGEEGSLWIAPCDHVQVDEEHLVWDHLEGERVLRRRSSGELRAVAARPARVALSRKAPERKASGRVSWTDDLAAHLTRGLLAGARDVVERRLLEAPEDGAAWVARGAMYVHDHAFDEALDAFKHAAAAHPRSEGLAYLRGTALLKAGRQDEALLSFLEAIQDDPDDWASSWQAADLYRRRGRTLLEELMLRRTADRLATDAPTTPSLGPAAVLVNSVHLDPQGTKRRVHERLGLRSADAYEHGGNGP